MQTAASQPPEQFERYLELFSPTDNKGRYLHFDQLKYRLPKELDTTLAWSVIKLSRQKQLMPVLALGQDNNFASLLLTPTIQKAISETDRNTTSAALEWMCSKIGEQQHLAYLLHDLVEDEAISSSQLEGAATTTAVAKDLLKRSRKPRTPDEKMIIGNFRMMQFAWDNRHKMLSTDLILELHYVGVKDINDQHYTPGTFRATDDVTVVDAQGDIVHIPPTAAGLEKRLKKLSDWVNSNHHDTDSRDYLHPLVKAIIIHFAIGFEHPFRDGNGRVARALFYWYMFKNDFATFRYITISLLLKNAPVQYGNSYLYTETDDMDLTYFIDYQCAIVIKAINKFKEAYAKTLQDTEDFNLWMRQSGFYKKLNDKQQTVFQVAKSGTAHYFTATSVKENLGCSYNTAAQVLNGLAELGLFQKKKEGREWVYSMLSKKTIQQQWKNEQ